MVKLQRGLADGLKIVRSLYRGKAAVAERVDQHYLKAFHVETHLDESIVSYVEAGKSIVLTGNPGDGKTHLIEILQDELEEVGAIVEKDASAVSNASIYEHWCSARERGLPYCLAVNEAVLFKLAKEHPDFAPLREAITQVQMGEGYEHDLDFEASWMASSVVVFDLSLRNVLSKRIVDSAIDHLINVASSGSFSSKDEQRLFLANSRILREQPFRDRLQVVFDLIARRGHHVTMRELQSFIAYLLLGNSDKELNQGNINLITNRPAKLIYTGNGRLFNLVRAVLDYRKLAHPSWEEVILDGKTSEEDWMEGSGITTEPVYEVEGAEWLKIFDERKIDFYFYHRCGHELLALANPEDFTFSNLIDHPSVDSTASLHKVIHMIGSYFNTGDFSEQLVLWQNHRYGLGGAEVVYAQEAVQVAELELVTPTLRGPAKRVFLHRGGSASSSGYLANHLLLRHKVRKQASLKLTYDLFVLLSKAEQGTPVVLLREEEAKRIWHFLGQLVGGTADHDAGHTIRVSSVTGEEVIEVEVDLTTCRYDKITILNEG